MLRLPFIAIPMLILPSPFLLAADHFWPLDPADSSQLSVQGDLTGVPGVEGNCAVFDGGGGGIAWVSTSDDYGRTWSQAGPSNLPMPRAKAFLGKLSTGQLYLISNLNNRDTLVVSVGRPGEDTLSSMWRIRHGKTKPPRFPGSAKSMQWSYPYAYEHDGQLYVVYSIGKEDCGLSIIPIKSLSTKSEKAKISPSEEPLGIPHASTDRRNILMLLTHDKPRSYHWIENHDPSPLLH